MKSFADKDVEVLGVSGDTVQAQEAFKKAQKLNFALLADEKGEVAKAFGVPTSKGGTVKAKVDDKDVEFTRGVTIKRWTFVIDKAGKIAYKNPEVKAAEDSKAVLAAIEKLK
jgi:peroxiredoxin Q/BCP